MKKLITIISVLATSLIFTACGGGGGGGTTAAVNAANPIADATAAGTSKTVPLNIGEATPVKAGYSIVESSEDAVLDILVVSESKTVTLITGAASLKMPI